MARATQVLIDLHALKENYQKAKSLAPDSLAYAVIKANAYGHGLTQVANSLVSVVDGFAVACVDEAVLLREMGVLLPILVLEGPMGPDECQSALDLDLQIAIHNEQQIQWLSQLDEGDLHLHVKVDSGMHRLGFSPQLVPSIISQLHKLRVVNDIQLMSHFACADDPNHVFTAEQIQNMDGLMAMGLPMSLSNSAAIFSLPQCHHQLIRPGIMLYGASPLLGQYGPDLDLQPVMTLQSEVIAIHQIKAGESVGYGQGFIAQQDSLIAVVAIGYGDGYPRSAKNGTPVLIKGKSWPLAGRVSMDMITVDVTGSDIQLGDRATLWGIGLSADVVAEHCGTIAYELFCQLTNRVNRHYLGS
ncbi:alanine racemase [Oceaniserpentilla sp. 4NH20-0058]|uniref:alanine racemase n=1 Tax=Oceaniserpentilla sp. 4NH20-0058 TaxID=3127660 RepID=UPI0031082D96